MLSGDWFDRSVFWLINGIVVLLSWYLQFVGLAWALVRMGSRFAVPSAVMIAAAVFLVLHLNYALAGWLLFDTLPTVWTLGGGLIIIGSGLYIWQRERVVRGRIRRPLPGQR